MRLSGNRYLAALAVLVLLAAAAWWINRAVWQSLYPFHYREYIVKEATLHGLSPFLVAAVIRVESKFQPRATSDQGARGLMQIMPETGAWVARRLGMESFHPDLLYDPALNIRIGTWYLSELNREFGNDLTLALAAYNGGRGNVAGWLAQVPAHERPFSVEDIPFAETRAFVARVFTDYQRYEMIYGHW